jgi:hypothetical protein
MSLYSSKPLCPYFLNDPQNLGAKLEADIFDELVAMNAFEILYNEKDLIKLFGWDASGIDQLALIGEYIIPLQNKWRMTRRRETQGVLQFIKSIKYVKKALNKEVLFGVLSSRITPFDDNRCWLETEKVYCVSHFEDMDTLVSKTIKLIQNELAGHNVTTTLLKN